MLGLTSSESQTIEAILQRHFTNVEQARAAGVSETNVPVTWRDWPWREGRVLAGKNFSARESGDELKLRGDQLLVDLRGLVGDERWPIIEARLKEVRAGVYGSMSLRADLFLDPAKNSDLVKVILGTDDKGTVRWFASGGNGSMSGNWDGVLSEFMPDGDPAKTTSPGPGGWVLLSDATRQRVTDWLQKEAIARVGKKESP